MKYFEIYCETTPTLTFTNYHNFSIIVKAKYKPQKRTILKYLGDKIGDYFINGIWLCDSANNDMNFVKHNAIKLH